MTVAFTIAALDDLRRAGPLTAALLLGQVRGLDAEGESGVPLVDADTGYRVVGALDGRARIVYDREGDGVVVRVVWVDGARSDGDAYAEALERMEAADPSEIVALADAVRRLARLTGTRVVRRRQARDPVPDWLAEALVHRAGADPLAVSAMDAASAFDYWNGSLSAT